MFVIHRKPPRSRAPANREAEIAHAMARKRAAGDDFYLVEKRLRKILHGDMTKTALVAFAGKLARITGKEVDREAIRAKEPLICWFCENHKDYILDRAPAAPAPPPPVIPVPPVIAAPPPPAPTNEIPTIDPTTAAPAPPTNEVPTIHPSSTEMLIDDATWTLWSTDDSFDFF
jgi:hypothetical protein